jgi:histidinol-phosphatase (PHP family)
MPAEVILADPCQRTGIQLLLMKFAKDPLLTIKETSLRNHRLPPDLHIHTPYSRHATGTMEETVLSAIDKGLTEIGFSDHFPYPDGFVEPVPNCAIPDARTFEMYIYEADRLREKYSGRIDIRLGTEIDFLPEYFSDIQEHLGRYRLDYVIGSIHFVDGIAIDYRENVLASQIDRLGGPEGLWDKYWTALHRFLSWNLFQIVGHLDLPRKFSITKNNKDFSDSIHGILDRIRDQGLVLDVNTGGIDRASDHGLYPSKQILRWAVEKNMEFSFGSDAHRSADVGRYFPETAEFLVSLGCKYAVSFHRGKKRHFRLE